MKMTYLCLVSSILICTMGLFAQPKIKVVEGKQFDFGDVYKGVKATQVMIVKNIGTDTLDISDVSAQCGCTATMLSKRKLGPSETGKLSITFSPSYPGKVTKHVYISSNDPGSPKDTIEFYANVMSVLTLSPEFFSFNISKGDTTYVKTITITNPMKQAIKILSVKSEFDQVKVSLLKTELMPGEQTELQAVLKPAKPGTYQGKIELTTDHPVQPKIEIQINEWFR